MDRAGSSQHFPAPTNAPSPTFHTEHLPRLGAASFGSFDLSRDLWLSFECPDDLRGSGRGRVEEEANEGKGRFLGRILYSFQAEDSQAYTEPAQRALKPKQ